MTETHKMTVVRIEGERDVTTLSDDGRCFLTVRVFLESWRRGLTTTAEMVVPIDAQPKVGDVVDMSTTLA